MRSNIVLHSMIRTIGAWLETVADAGQKNVAILVVAGQDTERRHTLESATAEYLRPVEASPSLGYEISIVPRAGVNERADFVLNALGKSWGHRVHTRRRSGTRSRRDMMHHRRTKR